jgi:NAD(P)-dependent dehydrogenase (short-subunit alcohol dehydrogenase family)
MINEPDSTLGPVNVLLNNAAGNFISPTERLSENAFRTIVDIVLIGTFNCSMAAQKVMKENGGGVILNISTTYAWTGSGYVVPSACAKAGVLAMTRSLAVEWAKYGIRTNAIAPGHGKDSSFRARGRNNITGPRPSVGGTNVQYHSSAVFFHHFLRCHGTVKGSNQHNIHNSAESIFGKPFRGTNKITRSIIQ